MFRLEPAWPVKQRKGALLFVRQRMVGQNLLIAQRVPNPVLGVQLVKSLRFRTEKWENTFKQILSIFSHIQWSIRICCDVSTQPKVFPWHQRLIALVVLCIFCTQRPWHFITRQHCRVVQPEEVSAPTGRSPMQVSPGATLLQLGPWLAHILVGIELVVVHKVHSAKQVAMFGRAGHWAVVVATLFTFGPASFQIHLLRIGKMVAPGGPSGE